MRDFLVTVGSMIVAVPVTILVIWVGFMLFGVVLRMLLVGAPIVAIGGVIIFVCQMLENRDH